MIRGTSPKLAPWVAFAVLAAACAGSAGNSEPRQPASDGQQISVETADVRDRLETLGIAVTSDFQASGESETPVRLVDDQLEGLVAELQSRGGATGAQLDDLVPMPEGAPPFSYLVAGWLSAVESPESEYALELLGGRDAHDWTRPADVVFPNLVITLFVSNVGREVGREAGVTFEAAGDGTVILAAGAEIVVAQGDVCGELQGWLGKILDALFGALKIEDSSWVPGFITVIWNAAVDLAQTVLEGLIEAITAPVLEAVKIGIGVVGTLALAASFLKSWTVDVLPSPIIDHFAHPGEADHEGTFTATATAGKQAEFAAALVSCAALAGFTLPSPLPPGKPVHWEMKQLGLRPVAEDIGHDDELSSGGTAQLRYRAGREDEDDPDGDLVNGSVQVIATVERLTEAELDALLGKLIFDGAAGELLAKVLGPLIEDVESKLSNLMDVNGSIVLAIDYHENEKERSCFQGVWSSTSYHATGQTVSGGTGIEVIIGSNLNGVITFDDSAPIVGQLQSVDAPQVMIVQAGGGIFSMEEPEPGVGHITAAQGSNYSLTPYVDLGGWVQSGPGTQSFSGGALVSSLQLTCQGDVMSWEAPGVSGYEFGRVDVYEAELPPPEPSDDDATDGTTTTVPPDWGDDLDPCKLLTLAQVKKLVPDAEKPEGEDEISTPLLRQCTYFPAMSIQATPPQSRTSFGQGAADFGLEVVDVDGVGDWAAALVNVPDPETGTDDSVFAVGATNSRATVTIYTWDSIYRDTPEWDTLLELLAAALANA